MKKSLSIIIALLLVAATFSSCKKEGAVIPPKDYSLSVKDKTWWGTLTNDGGLPQSYSVNFKPDNTVIWSQFSGDYPGTWSVSTNKLTITFNSPAVVVTGEISDDNKLMNITTNTVNKVNTGEMIANPNIVLDNTVWNGIITTLSQSSLIVLTFLTNSKVQIKLSSNPSVTVTYTRSASGGFFRFNWGNSAFAGVITSGTKINGIWDYNYAWQGTKQ